MLAHTPAFLSPGGSTASGSSCGGAAHFATAIRGAALASSDDGELHDPSYAESLRALHARIGQASSSSSSSTAAAAGSSRSGTPRRRSALLAAHPSPRSSPRLGGNTSLPTTPRLGAAAASDSSSDSDSDAEDAAADALYRRRLSASSSAQHDDDYSSRPPSLSTTRRASSRRASYATADLGCTTSGSASPFTPGTPLLLSANCSRTPRRPTSRDSTCSRTGRSLLSLDAPSSPTLASSGGCARRGSRKAAQQETTALDNWAGGFTGIVDVERRRATSTHSEEPQATAEAQPTRHEERKSTRRAFSAAPLGHRSRSAPRSRRAESAPPPHDGLSAPHMAPSSSDSGSSSHSHSSRPALPTPSRLSSNGRPMLSTIISSGAPERLIRTRTPLDTNADASDSDVKASSEHVAADAEKRSHALRRCVQSAWLGVRFKALNAKRRLGKHEADEKAW
ncbi:hypothetical protein FA09DRAFT_328616 [Tilletiopsis washingtonensis]|uniref:Uncharacterized protein n=1 Tax=Tilletiopsis washingtonensis TaxID=58919 RepID=A0A316ZF23_9BASI|nr:hypothetical protein FA09DRAFT_328616 [Tilletiopsis washingtonensis]PWN99836.1 hypothetical protein FA09DRAFT_328616 [Tilletiopsis washingtonensis]